jgi:hypothetical protein
MTDGFALRDQLKPNIVRLKQDDRHHHQLDSSLRLWIMKGFCERELIPWIASQIDLWQAFQGYLTQAQLSDYLFIMGHQEHAIIVGFQSTLNRYGLVI